MRRFCAGPPAASRLWLCAFLLALAFPAGAAGSFRTGLSGPEFKSEDPSECALWFDRAAYAQTEIVRINYPWRSAVVGQPADPSDPADPAYRFSPLDAAVRDASARGFDVLITTYSAPGFAEAANRPEAAAPGTWKPDPAAYAAFARALAARYSGSFGDLPRVRYFQAWNEPNLHTFLNPQWEGLTPFSPTHYRRMLNAFTEAVHDVHGDNVVVTGGTAPFGDERGSFRMRPLRFLRELLCLRKVDGRLKGTSCPEKASFDILDHHPINTGGGPRQSAVHPDNATTLDFKYVRDTLRAAESSTRSRAATPSGRARSGGNRIRRTRPMA